MPCKKGLETHLQYLGADHPYTAVTRARLADFRIKDGQSPRDPEVRALLEAAAVIQDNPDFPPPIRERLKANLQAAGIGE